MLVLRHHVCMMCCDMQRTPRAFAWALHASTGTSAWPNTGCNIGTLTEPIYLMQVSLVPYRAPGLPDLPKGFRKRKLELIPPELIIASESTSVGELKAMVADALSCIYRWVAGGNDLGGCGCLHVVVQGLVCWAGAWMYISWQV